MAGTRMYYSNVLTTTRGSVEAGCKYTVVTGPSASATVATGRGFSNIPTASFSTAGAAGGTNNAFTVTFPEKYGRCINIDCEVVDTASSGIYACVKSDYNPATGQATFQILTNTAAAAPNATYSVYVYGMFELGM